MDLIYSLIHSFIAINDVTKLYATAGDWVVATINHWSQRKPAQVIEVQVASMGDLSEADIRAAVAQALGANRGTAVPASQREELIGVLHNMSRKVRAQTSAGSLPGDGSFLRSERILDWLISDVEPARHAGEPVAPGSPWVLKRHLGMGSFGEVWEARNPDYPTPRAYKFFTRDGSGDWLRREQKSLVALLRQVGEHDQIVAFEDVQVDNAPYPYLAFEHMAGGSLEEWILKDADRRPRLPVGEIVRQVARGLADAHAQRIYHRDVKPANILLTGGDDPQVKIGDFGLAKVAATTARPEASFLGSLGGAVGTALYLPPEAQHRSARRKPAQDDVFALGVVWYQLLVGAIERPPYDFAARLAARGVDAHTTRLVERCLAGPDRRYRHAGAVLEKIAEDWLPEINPPVPGVPDVQHLAREYLATTLVDQA